MINVDDRKFSTGLVMPLDRPIAVACTINADARSVCGKINLLVICHVFLLHCALASGAKHFNRSCLCVCVFVTGGRAGGVRTLLQLAPAQCLRLSERFFILFFVHCYYCNKLWNKGICARSLGSKKLKSFIVGRNVIFVCIYLIRSAYVCCLVKCLYAYVHGRRNRGVWGSMSPPLLGPGGTGGYRGSNENDLCFYSRHSLFSTVQVTEFQLT